MTELLAPPAWRNPPARGPRDPEDDAEALLLLTAAVESIDEIAAEICAVMQQELRGERITTPASCSGTPDLTALSRDLAIDSEQLRSLLRGSISSLLARLQRNIVGLRRAASLTVRETVDGSCLRDQYVLECLLRFWGRYHVRIFERGREGPLVILGELSDNHAGNITNNVEPLTRLIATTFPQHFDLARITWIQYEPAELTSWQGTDNDEVDSSRQSDTATLVSFDDSAEHRGPSWTYMDPSNLAGIVGCPVRRWHARDYTSAQVRRDGVRVVTMPTCPTA